MGNRERVRDTPDRHWVWLQASWHEEATLIFGSSTIWGVEGAHIEDL